MTPTRLEIWTRSGTADWRDAIASAVLAGELRRLSPELPIELRTIAAGETSTAPEGSHVLRIFCGEGIVPAVAHGDVTGSSSDVWFSVRVPPDLDSSSAALVASAAATLSPIFVCDDPSLEALEALGVIGEVEVVPPLTVLAGRVRAQEEALRLAEQLRQEGTLPEAQYVLAEDDPRFTLADLSDAIPRGSPVVLLTPSGGPSGGADHKLGRAGHEIITVSETDASKLAAAVAAARSIIAASPSLAGLAAAYGIPQTAPGLVTAYAPDRVADLESRLERVAPPPTSAPDGRVTALETLQRRFERLRARSATQGRPRERSSPADAELRQLALEAQDLAMRLADRDRQEAQPRPNPDSSRHADDIEATLATLREERDALREQLLATLNSRSWRLLAPARRTATLARRLLRKR